MNINSFFAALFLLFKIYTLYTQATRTQTLIFQPIYGNIPLQLNDSYYKLDNNDSIQFETLKWYISKIEFLKDANSVWKEDQSFHLMDASDKNSCQLEIQIPSGLVFNEIKFNLGIDSTTNVSGAMGGDLDPTRGMYWTWQSGYINFKLEGKSNRCNTRNHEFQFHLGGYQYPYNAFQTITLPVNNHEKIHIFMDLSKWISEIDLSKQNHIMSPSADAVLLSEKITQNFSVDRP